MKRAVFIIAGLLLMTPPAWAWIEYLDAQDLHTTVSRELAVARQQVSELVQQANADGASIKATPNSVVLAAMDRAADTSGLAPSVISEVTTRTEPVRSALGTIKPVQTTRVRLEQISPTQLGLILGSLRASLPEMVPSEIELTRIGVTAPPNTFSVLLVLEQHILRETSIGADS